MLSRSLLVLAPVVIVFAVGCQGPDITAELDTYQELFDDTTWLLCDCPQDLGFATTGECRDVYGRISPDERQCLEDVLDGHESDARDFLLCTNAARQDYEQCLAANADCQEGVNDACTSVYTVEAARCMQLPSDVQAGFLACTG
jgi:hypothetical protein